MAMGGIGLARATTRIGPMSLADNMRRLAQQERFEAAAN